VRNGQYTTESEVTKISHSVEVKSVAIISRRALVAAARDLKKQGINCDLVRLTAPRMWFKDQLQRQLGKSSEICDYVLQLHDCPYDVGFIKQGKSGYRCLTT